MKKVIGLLFGLVLSFMLALSASAESETTVYKNTKFPGFSDDYKVTIKIKTTNDADGWNDAYINIYRRHDSGTSVYWYCNTLKDLEDDFDNKAEMNYEETKPNFPYKIEIYTDIGGGMTSRKWEGDVSIYINGVNVASKHIISSSSLFSSSKTYNVIDVDETKYPYIEKLYLEAPEKVSFYGDKASFDLKANAVDQYGVYWKSTGSVLDESGKTELFDDTGAKYDRYIEDEWANIEKGEYIWKNVTSKGTDDRKTKYTISFETANSLYPVCKTSFEVSYIVEHRLEIEINGEKKDTVTGYNGDKYTVDYPELDKTGYVTTWTCKGGTFTQGDTQKGGIYSFGKEDGTLTAVSEPVSYTVFYRGNGHNSGTMGGKSCLYDKSFTLLTNTYKKTGHTFTGWNTEPDGSGTAYENGATVKNLSSENGGKVYLYAQWKANEYTVKFVNSITDEKTSVTVTYGSEAQAPEMKPIDNDEKTHYVFSKWDKSFSKVKNNITVTAAYTTEDHTFETETVKEATANETGLARKVCTVCGHTKEEIIPLKTGPDTASSVFGGGSVIIIVLCVLAVIAGGVAVVVIKKRADAKKSDEAGTDSKKE